jgi:predicted nucleic acid-binding protein
MGLSVAHNQDSELNSKAKAFLETVMNDRDEDGNLSVCLPTQVLTEFISVITKQVLENPLSLSEAISVVRDYLDSEVVIIHQTGNQLETFLDLLSSVTSRKKIFDVVLAASLKDNGISGIYTVNVNDFNKFEFLEVVNPLKSEEEKKVC